MKIVYCLFATCGCCIFYFLGVNAGLSLRPVSPSAPSPVPFAVSSDQQGLRCTCVPCLPDMFCLKCGHKSRDCPKLRGYFSSSNSVSSVSTNNFKGVKL